MSPAADRSSSAPLESTDTRADIRRDRSLLPMLLAVLGLLAALVALSGWGGPHDPMTGALVVVERTLSSGLLAAAVLMAGYGFGRVADRVHPGADDKPAWRWCLGIAILFTLLHLLGWLGVLTPLVAAGVTVAGLGCAAIPPLISGRVHRVQPDAPHVGQLGSWMTAAWTLAIGLPVLVLVVACANPPGWLWSSEFGGYDALSYHLQLPKEWIGIGAIRPLEHNVYSYLPSYAEAGFMHLGQLARLLTGADQGDAFIAGDGLATHASQFLHGGLGLIAARVVAGFVRTGVVDRASGGLGGMVAGGVLIATPWVVVVGSLAYNELGVVLLSAGAMMAALDPRGTDARRGLVAGALVGVACGFKPTALFMVAPAVGLALVFRGADSAHVTATPKRFGWVVAVAAAGAGGLVMIAPWLIRNWLAGGNPVFPQLPGVFGGAHWDAEQLARYAAAHTDDAGALERLRLLLWTDPRSGPGAATVERFRGFANPQWAGLALIGMACAAIGWWRGGNRRLIAVLSGGLVLQVIAWLVVTHLQSRFLLPSVVWLAALIGVACAGTTRASRPRDDDARARAPTGAFGLALVGAIGLVTGWTFLHERPVNNAPMPNAMLVPGISAAAGDLRSSTRHGEPSSDATGSTQEQSEGLDPSQMSWTAAVNRVLGPGDRVLLVGDATPFALRVPVTYATTYDRSALAHAMLDYPADPAAWTRALREAGVTHVVIAPSELARLDGSGWLDPVYTSAVIPDASGAETGLARPALEVWINQLGLPMIVWHEQQGRALFRLRPSPSPIQNQNQSGGSLPTP